jgi:hypothetical protein
MHPPFRRRRSTEKVELEGVLLIMTKQLTRSVGYRWLEADSLDEKPVAFVALCCLSTAVDVRIGRTALM